MAGMRDPWIDGALFMLASPILAVEAARGAGEGWACLPRAEATLNAVQKRLRKLAEAGYLRSYREHPTAEAIHALGPKGKLMVEERGIEVAFQAEVPRQLEHLLGLNAIRLCVEMSRVPIIYFFSWQELRGM